MLRFAPFSILLFSTLPAWPQGVSHPISWRYLHPRAQVLVGVDFRALSTTPVGAQFAQEFDRAGLPLLVRQEGLEFLLSVDRVLLSAPADSNAKSNSAVIVLEGRFDPAQVRSAFRARHATSFSHSGVEIFRRRGEDMMLALVSPQILLVGDLPSLRSAIAGHRAADPRPATLPVLRRAVELARLYDVWMAANLPPEALAKASVPSPNAFLDDVRALEAGVSFRSGLDVQVGLDTSSPVAAQRLAGMLQGLLQLGVASRPEPGVRDIADRLRFHQNESRVALSLHLEPAEVGQHFNQVKGSLANDLALAALLRLPDMKAAPSPVPTVVLDPIGPPPPPRPRVIKILNAEGGAREIGLPPR